MRIAIIGTGPIGLYFAGLCEAEKVNYEIFEADSSIGGQLTHLYPEKLITNIPGIKEIKAADYIELLKNKINDKKIRLNSKIIELDILRNNFDYIINATGIGEYIPRKLGLENEENCNVLYALKDYSFLKNKKVIVFGGGDSALDWAKQLSEISEVSLVHRRDEFRGNAETIQDCKLDLYLSYIPHKITKNKILIKSVKTDNLIELDYDYILVNFGQIVQKTEYKQIENLFNIGDCTGSKTIADGIKQADEVFRWITIKN